MIAVRGVWSIALPPLTDLGEGRRGVLLPEGGAIEAVGRQEGCAPVLYYRGTPISLGPGEHAAARALAAAMLAIIAWPSRSHCHR